MPRFAPIRSALVAFFFGLFALTARAQSISVYATAAPSYLDHLYTLSGGANPQSSLSGQWFTGVNAGVTFTFSDSGPVSLGLDFRGGPEIGTPGMGSALAGFKLGFKSPRYHLKPYTQISLGFLEQRHQTGSGASAYLDAETYFAGELIGGVDLPVARHVDIRVVELDLGATHVIDNNGVNTISHPQIFGLNSGLVFNF